MERSLDYARDDKRGEGRDDRGRDTLVDMTNEGSRHDNVRDEMISVGRDGMVANESDWINFEGILGKVAEKFGWYDYFRYFCSDFSIDYHELI